MTIPSTAGISANWAATRVDPSAQAAQTAMLKEQIGSEQDTAEWIAEASEAERSPPAPPGQGLHVDKRA